MKLYRCDAEGVPGGGEWEGSRQAVGVRNEDRVGGAFEAGEDVCSEVLLRGVVSLQFAISDWRVGGLRTLTGQMKYLYRISTFVMAKPKKMVRIQAPTNPSTVFLGDSLISCVRPNVIPQM